MKSLVELFRHISLSYTNSSRPNRSAFGWWMASAVPRACIHVAIVIVPARHNCQSTWSPDGRTVFENLLNYKMGIYDNFNKNLWTKHKTTINNNFFRIIQLNKSSIWVMGVRGHAVYTITLWSPLVRGNRRAWALPMHPDIARIRPAPFRNCVRCPSAANRAAAGCVPSTWRHGPRRWTLSWSVAGRQSSGARRTRLRGIFELDTC